MGMFDWIKFETECPNCKTKVDGFQSKDGACGLYNLDYWDVDNFYSSCPKCNTEIEYTIKLKSRNKIPIEDYNKKVKIPTKKQQREHKERYRRFKDAMSGKGEQNG